MALTQTTMFSNLNNEPRSTVEEAAEDFSEAYRAWFSQATGLISLVPLDAAKIAMKNVLVFSSEVPDGAALLQAGIVAFWVSVSTSASTLYTNALSATPPAVLTGIGAALTALNLNTPGVTNEQAMLSFASVLHTNGLGGFWVLPAAVTVAIL